MKSKDIKEVKLKRRQILLQKVQIEYNVVEHIFINEMRFLNIKIGDH